MAPLRTLWSALVGLYEDTLVLVAGNVLALGLNLPIGLLLFLVGLALPIGDEGWLVLLGLIASVMVFLPTPGNVALGGLTRVAAGPDVPRLWQFRNSLSCLWRVALRCSVVSVVVLVGLVWNAWFYFTVGADWLKFVAILWLYAGLFWLSLHIYLVPLIVHVEKPRVVDLYRRAMFIALGHFFYALVLLAILLVGAFVSFYFLPVYVLVWCSFVSLAQAQALREIRRRHGDLPAEVDEEVSRL